MNRHVSRLFAWMSMVIVAHALCLPGVLQAGVIATNEDVTTSMTVAGTEADPSIYILDDYEADFGSGSISIGSISASWVQLIITNGASLKATGNSNWIGSAPGGDEGNHCTLRVTGAGSALTLGETRLGNRSSNNTIILEDGATGSIGRFYVARDSDTPNPSSNKVVVVNATLSITGRFDLGDRGGYHALEIREGGTVTVVNEEIIMGLQGGSHNQITVDGISSVLTIEKNASRALSLAFNGASTDSSLTVRDGALVKFTGASASVQHIRDGCYVRLAAGWIAQLSNNPTWLGHEDVQLWSGSEWEAAPSGWVGTYYADDEDGEAAALAATGYTGLGGYTVFTGGKPIVEHAPTTLITIR